jgi:hypothetical protein
VIAGAENDESEKGEDDELFEAASSGDDLDIDDAA